MEDKNMFNEEKFQFNIENIKNDLAIEGMDITENDVNMYRMLAENEVAMPELISMIKEQIQRIKKLSKFLNLIDNFLII